MKTNVELRKEAEEACIEQDPYERDAWIYGYLTAATEYEKELDKLRTLLRKAEDDIKLAKEIMRHGG